MTIEELKAQIAALTKQLEEMIAAEAEPAEEAPAEPEAPKALLRHTNLWHFWFKTEAHKLGTSLPPYLDIDGVEFDENGWSEPDEEGGFIYKPMIDRRTQMENSTNRASRYAAKWFPDYHTKWVTLPPGYESDDFMAQWVLGNYSAAARNWSREFDRINKWEPYPAYATFETPFRIMSWRRRPVKSTFLHGYKTIFGGNYGIEKSRQNFEDHVSDARVNRHARVHAGYVMDLLDRQYSLLQDEEQKADFLDNHPAYEPPE